MALNNIVLSQANGIKVFYPITRMFTEPLYNVTRSSNRWEGFRVGPSTEALQPFTAQCGEKEDRQGCPGGSSERDAMQAMYNVTMQHMRDLAPSSGHE